MPVTVLQLSAAVTYAVSVYLEHVAQLGPRLAYDAAIEAADLRTAAERQQLRQAIYRSGRA